MREADGDLEDDVNELVDGGVRSKGGGAEGADEQGDGGEEAGFQVA
ncbi:hypothetical protein [Nonomuraea sp. C10]|jgi:hypothetical protein|nr:hypothetical protein [Nonomuraea sp. C10]